MAETASWDIVNARVNSTFILVLLKRGQQFGVTPSHQECWIRSCQRSIRPLPFRDDVHGMLETSLYYGPPPRPQPNPATPRNVFVITVLDRTLFIVCQQLPIPSNRMDKGNGYTNYCFRLRVLISKTNELFLISGARTWSLLPEINIYISVASSESL